MDLAGLHRLCDGEQYYPFEVAVAEEDSYRRTERSQGCVAADLECFDEPEPRLSALEGYGNVVRDKRNGKYKGGQDLVQRLLLTERTMDRLERKPQYQHHKTRPALGGAGRTPVPGDCQLHPRAYCPDLCPDPLSRREREGE